MLEIAVQPEKAASPIELRVLGKSNVVNKELLKFLKASAAIVSVPASVNDFSVPLADANSAPTFLYDNRSASILEQDANADVPIEVTFGPTSTYTRFVQPENAAPPIVVREAGRIRFEKVELEHPLKALSEICSKPVPNSTLAFEKSMNAEFPTILTLLPKTIVSIFALELANKE